MDIRILIEYDAEAAAYSATCPELNFVSSCGETKEEAVTHLKEAIQLLLTPLPDELLETPNLVEIQQIAL